VIIGGEEGHADFALPLFFRVLNWTEDRMFHGLGPRIRALNSDESPPPAQLMRCDRRRHHRSCAGLALQADPVQRRTVYRHVIRMARVRRRLGRLGLDRAGRLPSRRTAQSSVPEPATMRASVGSTEASGK
jgi:hypothetical protein